MKAYDEAVSNGIRIEPQSFYNLLNLCDGLGSRGIHIGTPKPLANASSNDDNDTKTTDPVAFPLSVTNTTTTTTMTNNDEAIDVSTRLAYAERIKSHMDTIHLPLTETAYSALVKLHCKVQNTTKAEELLTQAEQIQQCKPKLRLYAALLTTFCEMGQLTQALRIWKRLSQRDLLLSEKEYTALMNCCLMTGNAVVMERVLSDLAEDILVPSKATCQAICEWFQSPFAVAAAQAQQQQQQRTASLPKCKVNNNDYETISQLLQQIQLPYSEQAVNMGPVQCNNECHWTISQNVGIHHGQLQAGCLRGESLRPFALSATAHQTMKEMNETIVLTGKLDQDMSAFQGGKKGPKRQLQDSHLETRKRHWQAFNDYLARREYKIDVVIDGANVGYHEQNFAGAPKHVNYEQIDWIVQHFVQQGKSVLLILHNRHFARGQMPRSAESTVQKWKNHVLYRTPPGMNDDWFWLYAALKSESSDNVLVVTNDEMRDHHFQMLAPRSFLRWKDRHQVHFTFGDWERSNATRTGRKQRRISLTYPESYSRRIQRVGDGLVIPLPMKGDENRFLDGSFMAEDVDTPEEERYLCIRPVSRKHDAKKE